MVYEAMKHPLFSCEMPVQWIAENEVFIDGVRRIIACVAGHRCGDGIVRHAVPQNGFRITVGGIWRLRLWRLLSGCYFREQVDACRLRGKEET